MILGVAMDPLGKIYEVLEDNEFNLVLKIIPNKKMVIDKVLLKHGWVYERTLPKGHLMEGRV